LAGFEESDAPLFENLGRKRDVQNLLQAVTAANFRIGYLTGESGAGKSSLLRAGLIPALKKDGHGVFLVEITNADPMAAISAVLKTPWEAAAGILILDQFEQWFIHRPRGEQREPFLNKLSSWYAAPSNLKILVCVREDFAGRLAEIQQRLGYSLSMQNNQTLRRFSVAQAAVVLEVICQEEGIAFSREFVGRQLKEEVADRGDGLISPFDLQILAFVVASARRDREIGFKEDAFRLAGGVEGLMDHYLRGQLKALSASHQGSERRNAAIAVLRSLSDLKTVAGDGVLSEDQIHERLHSSNPPASVHAAVEWLASPSVRLIVPRQDGFRLVHDRLAAGVRRLVSKSLPEAESANELLSLRVTEYLTNGRKSRYLLRFHEWRTIERQRPFLDWSERESEKRELLAESKARFTWRAGLAVSAALALAAGWGAWESPWVLRWRLRGEIVDLSKNLKDTGHRSDVARNLVRAGYKREAAALFKLPMDEPDGDSEQRTEGLNVAKILAQIGDKTGAMVRFHKAEEGIDDLEPRDRIDALLRIGLAMAQSGFVEQAAGMFERSQQAASYITRPDESSQVLRNIAADIAHAAHLSRTPSYVNADEAAALFRQARDAATRIDSSQDRNAALQNVAVAMAQATDMSRGPVLFDEAEHTAAQIADPRKLSDTLRGIAIARAKAGEKDKAALLFEKADEAAAQIADAHNLSVLLWQIASAMVQVGEKGNALALLRHAEEISSSIVEPDNQCESFWNIALVSTKAGDANAALQRFKQAAETAQRIPSRGASSALRNIARAAAQAGAALQGEGKDASAFFSFAKESATSIKRRDDRSDAWKNIAIAMAQAGEKTKRPDTFKEAENIIGYIAADADQSDALRMIAIAMADRGDLRAARRVGWKDPVLQNRPVTLSSVLAESIAGFEADSDLPALH
jgi:tetratricopeptide (TPR) repeat protein